MDSVIDLPREEIRMQDNAATSDEPFEINEFTNDYSIDEDGPMIDLTAADIELLRASAVEGEPIQGSQTPLQCEWLPDAPAPNQIQDIYSPLLGDVFHATQRSYVPIHHEAKKGYFVAFQNAFFVWHEDQMNELVRRMKESGLSDGEIERMRYYNSKVFTDCVQREVPPPSILYWRVRAVFALYGGMKDSKTGKPLFNAKAWVKARGILNEILEGYYSDPPGMCMYT